jgi:hypothetical protein
MYIKTANADHEQAFKTILRLPSRRRTTIISYIMFFNKIDPSAVSFSEVRLYIRRSYGCKGQVRIEPTRSYYGYITH